MSAIATRVMKRGPSRFNMVGQKLPDSLQDVDEAISAGLAARLHRYALRGLLDAGFEVETWAVEVYTMDGELAPSERYYCVEFTNARGGMLGVSGIMTSRGHPCLDHGTCVDIGRERLPHTPEQSPEGKE